MVKLFFLMIMATFAQQQTSDLECGLTGTEEEKIADCAQVYGDKATTCTIQEKAICENEQQEKKTEVSCLQIGNYQRSRIAVSRDKFMTIKGTFRLYQHEVFSPVIDEDDEEPIVSNRPLLLSGGCGQSGSLPIRIQDCEEKSKKQGLSSRFCFIQKHSFEGSREVEMMQIDCNLTDKCIQNKIGFFDLTLVSQTNASQRIWKNNHTSQIMGPLTSEKSSILSVKKSCQSLAQDLDVQLSLIRCSELRSNSFLRALPLFDWNQIKYSSEDSQFWCRGEQDFATYDFNDEQIKFPYMSNPFKKYKAICAGSIPR